MKQVLLLVLACLVLPAQTQDPARDPLERAYQALRDKKYLEAIDHFLAAVEAAPTRAAIRKELGYAYLKAGETSSAREVFEQALTLEPGDFRTALELAFLSYETGREARALELFEQVQRRGDAESKKTAAEAFGRVDGALRAAIARWSAAVEQDPSNRAARLELASYLEKHHEAARAAEQYLAAWRLGPQRPETLLDLACSRHEAGDEEGATGAWLLASHSTETRVAERARARLPRREPFANEYRRALELDPSHTGLRRELAFLWLAVNRPDDAMEEFEKVVREDPSDLLAAAQLGFLYLEREQPVRATPLLERVVQGPDRELARRAREKLGRKPAPSPQELALPHKTLAEKSLAASYLRDALREFQTAYEMDPGDYQVALKLGVIHNILKDDREALRWFRQAKDSPDPAVAAEARRNYNNLAPQFRRAQTSVWTLPLFSTRYHDVFLYSQLKTELRLGRIALRPYVSLRLVGDAKRQTGGPLPQFLSESSLIGAMGARTPTWKGLTLWAEAGEGASYLRRPPPGARRLGPDYRGGLAWSRNLGKSLGAETAGAFAEFNEDAVFLSRFRNNVINYWQTRAGYRLPQVGAWRSQIFWNTQFTVDRRREWYANFVEWGPGVRFRIPGLARPLDVTVSGLRGVYLINAFNPGKPIYYDLRISLWYAVAH